MNCGIAYSTEWVAEREAGAPHRQISDSSPRSFTLSAASSSQIVGKLHGLSSCAARNCIIMRHAVVTGAARHRRGDREAFHAAGCRVTAIDRDFSNYTDHRFHADFDLRELSAIRGVVDGLPEIDVSVNNAGVLHCPPTDRLATEGTLGQRRWPTRSGPRTCARRGRRGCRAADDCARQSARRCRRPRG